MRRAAADRPRLFLSLLLAVVAVAASLGTTRAAADDDDALVLLRGRDGAAALDAAFAALSGGPRAADADSADNAAVGAASPPTASLLRGAAPATVAEWRGALLRDADAAFHPPSGGVMYTCRGISTTGGGDALLVATSSAEPSIGGGPDPLPPPPEDDALAAAAAAATAAAAALGTAGALAPRDADPSPADVFRLHSRPQAPYVIVLDFTGHQLALGTAWGDTPAPAGSSGNGTAASPRSVPAFDSDGNPSSFSDAERRAIASIWRAVSEDYAPFDVDVTTEEPAAGAWGAAGDGPLSFGAGGGAGAAARPGVRAAIGGGGWLGASGGVGLLQSFGERACGPVVFVFSDNLGRGDPTAVAEAVSHEVGHALGLLHDGLVAGPPPATPGGPPPLPAAEYYQGREYSPIMGRSYGSSVTHFDRGDYPRASNQQDDFAVIQRFLRLLGDEGGAPSPDGGGGGGSGGGASGFLRAADVGSASGVVLQGTLRTLSPRYWRFSLPPPPAAPAPPAAESLSLRLDVQPPTRAPAFGGAELGRADLGARVRVLQDVSAASGRPAGTLLTELMAANNTGAGGIRAARSWLLANTGPLPTTSGAGAAASSSSTRDFVIEILPVGDGRALADGGFGAYGCRGAFQLELRGTFAPPPPVPSPSPTPVPLPPPPPPILACAPQPVVISPVPGEPECGDGALAPVAELYKLLDSGGSGVPLPPGSPDAANFAVMVDPAPASARVLPGTEQAFAVRLVRASVAKLPSASAEPALQECSAVVRVSACAADAVACAGGGGSGSGGGGAPKAPPAVTATLKSSVSCRGAAINESALYATASGRPAQSIFPPLPALLGPGRHNFSVVARGAASACTAAVVVTPCRPACRSGAAVDALPGTCAAAAPLPLASAVISDATLGEGAVGAVVAASSSSSSSSSSSTPAITGKRAVKLAVLYPGGLRSAATSRACRVAVRDAEPPTLAPTMAAAAAAAAAAASSKAGLPDARVCAYPRSATSSSSRVCVPASAAFFATDNCPLPAAPLRVAGCLPPFGDDNGASAAATPASSLGFCSASAGPTSGGGDKVCVSLAGMVPPESWREARAAVKAVDAAGNAAPSSSSSSSSAAAARLYATLVVRAYASAGAAQAAGEAPGACVAAGSS